MDLQSHLELMNKWINDFLVKTNVHSGEKNLANENEHHSDFITSNTTKQSFKRDIIDSIKQIKLETKVLSKESTKEREKSVQMHGERIQQKSNGKTSKSKVHSHIRIKPTRCAENKIYEPNQLQLGSRKNEISAECASYSDDDDDDDADDQDHYRFDLVEKLGACNLEDKKVATVKINGQVYDDKDKRSHKKEDKNSVKDGGHYDVNGYYFDKNGRSYDEDGGYYDKNGHYYDKNGRSYDENGGYYDENGHYYDKNGRSYDENGGFYDENGHYYDENGQFYDENGDYYEESEDCCSKEDDGVLFDPGDFEQEMEVDTDAEEEYQQKQQMKRVKKQEEQHDRQQFKHIGHSDFVTPTTKEPSIMDHQRARDRQLKQLYGSQAEDILSAETKLACDYDATLASLRPEYWPIVPLNYKYL